MRGSFKNNKTRTQRIFLHQFFVVDFLEKLQMKVVLCKIFLAGASACFSVRTKGLVNINMANGVEHEMMSFSNARFVKGVSGDAFPWQPGTIFRPH